jgi:hypothetical protein
MPSASSSVGRAADLAPTLFTDETDARAVGAEAALGELAGERLLGHIRSPRRGVLSRRGLSSAQPAPTIAAEHSGAGAVGAQAPAFEIQRLDFFFMLHGLMHYLRFLKRSFSFAFALSTD